jgi:hypothetical protein
VPKKSKERKLGNWKNLGKLEKKGKRRGDDGFFGKLNNLS